MLITTSSLNRQIRLVRTNRTASCFPPRFAHVFPVADPARRPPAASSSSAVERLDQRPQVRSVRQARSRRCSW